MRIFPVLAVVLAFCGLIYGGPTEGKAVYDKSCKSCHGADGKGNPAIAKVMKVELRPLGSSEVQAKSDAELKKIITDGTGKMKPIASVTGKSLEMSWPICGHSNSAAAQACAAARRNADS